MLNARLNKNPEMNGFELRLFEKVDEKTFNYLKDEMGMYFMYETFNGKRVTKMWRSYDPSHAQNIKGNGYRQKPNLKYTPEQAYAILEKKVKEIAEDNIKAKAKTTEKAKSKTPAKAKTKTASKKTAEKKTKKLEDMTKAELLALLQSALAQ